MNVRLRDLTPDDLPAFADLHSRVFHQGWTVANITDLLTVPGTLGLVAADTSSRLLKSRLLGGILIRTLFDQSEILTFCVDPPHRRNGIGRKLLDAAVNIARAAGAETMTLEVSADNQRALALYRLTGFAVAGIRKDYYESPSGNSDAVIMTKRLIE